MAKDAPPRRCTRWLLRWTRPWKASVGPRVGRGDARRSSRHHLGPVPQRIVGTLFERVRLPCGERPRVVRGPPAPGPPPRGREQHRDRASCSVSAKSSLSARTTAIAIGCRGTLPSPVSLEEIVARLSRRQGEQMRTLPFGPAAGEDRRDRVRDGRGRCRAGCRGRARPVHHR